MPGTGFGRRMLLGAGVLALPRLAMAQADWPNRPVRVVIPWPPGGGADTVGRILFARLSETLGQSFVIENRPGATGTIGAAAVARGPADGYTVLYDSTAQSINPALMPNMPFDVRRDLQTVFLAAEVPNLLVANNEVPVRTVADVIAMAKATPGGIDCASSGNGSVQHMALELFRQMAGIPINHVPYRGGGPALSDIIAGQIKFYFSNASASTNFVTSGAVHGIAHTGRLGRLPALPGLPAVAETLPGFEAYEWNGVFFPTAVPEAITLRLNAALNDAIEHPAVMERLAGLSVQAHRNTPAEFRAFLERETAKWARVIHDGNIRME